MSLVTRLAACLAVLVAVPALLASPARANPLTDDQAQAMAEQADGKLVVVGTSDIGRPDFAVARYNPDGSLDTSFSGDGLVKTDFGDTSDLAHGVAIQGDGKVVVVGTTTTPLATDYDFAIARYNPDGTLDTSFGGDGRVTTDLGGMFDLLETVAIDADGGILAAGTYTEPGGIAYSLTVTRYEADGSVDTGFGENGSTIMRPDADQGDAAEIAVQPDGKILLAGATGVAFGTDFLVARFNADGSPDPTFGDGGVAVADFPLAEEWAMPTSLALQSDGRIVVAGWRTDAGGVALARFRADGSLDPSFSEDGTVLGGGVQPFAVAIDLDDRVVVAGRYGSDFAIARYRSDGSLDRTLSGNGRQRTDFGGIDSAAAVAVRADESIVAAGATRPDDGRSGRGGSDFALAGYDIGGALDPAFSSDGLVTTDFAPFTTLTVVASGAGTVAGASLPAGCRATCPYRVPDDAVVSLTADPDPGSMFAGWSGSGCSGTGACSITLDANKTVSAGFNVDVQPPPADDGQGACEQARDKLEHAKKRLKQAKRAGRKHRSQKWKQRVRRARDRVEEACE